MINVAIGFSNTTYKYDWQGPNSNTFARYVVGVGGFGWAQPPDAIFFQNNGVKVARGVRVGEAFASMVGLFKRPLNLAD